MAFDERSQHTLLCSILFLDIVGFSEHSVSDQMSMKEVLNRLLAHAIQDVNETNRIILDTGDGAALCFTGEPEDALFTALNLQSALKDETWENSMEFAVRMGINLGPVRRVKDLNGQVNVIGDGINAGQRVMSFAAPNQILVSRSYYEVVSRLSDEYAALFHYQGVRQDKHVREFTVYEITVGSDRHAETDQPGQSGTHSEETGSTSPPPIDVVAVQPAVTAPPPRWDPELLSRVEQELARYIGPISGTLVRRSANATKRVEDLYQSLAEHLTSDQDRRAFLAHAPFASQSPPPSVDLPAASASTEAHHWDLDVLEHAERELASYLGPIAKVLVKRAAKTSATLDELYSQLAEQLSSEREKQAFLGSLQGRRS